MTSLFGSGEKFRAAAVQMRTGLSVEGNVAAATRLIREAAAAGAGYVLTPEMTTVLDRDRTRLLAAIDTEERDPSLAKFKALARELGIHLHIGSMAIRVADGGVANRAFLIGPNGEVFARYDKIHMFDVDLPDGETYRESSLYRAGSEAAVADLPWARIGLTVCYDVRFPHLYRHLAQAGASLIAVPAAFTKTTGEAHWHVLVRARAIETGAYVVAAAQAGHHEDGRDTYGHSLIVDPWGRILSEAGTEPGVIVAEIDPAASAAARRRIPALASDRPFEPAVPSPSRPRLKSMAP
jgi:predicted amidohydrolase